MLKPGGAFLFNVWDRIEENEFADVVTTALSNPLFPDDPPRFMARTPHGYHDIATIARDLAGGGFAASPAVPHGRRAQQGGVAAHSRRSPTARERRCATKSRRATRRGSAKRPTSRRRRSPARFGRGAVDGKIQAHVVAVER